MGQEIERKFLVNKELWDKFPKGNGIYIIQGFITTDPDLTTRVRISDNIAYLTFKNKTTGISRTEIEFEIPLENAKELFNSFVKSKVEKRRYRITHFNKLWEIDEFLGDNEGLIIAEIELNSESEEFEKLPFIEDEVSGDLRYYNSKLSENPFKSW